MEIPARLRPSAEDTERSIALDSAIREEISSCPGGRMSYGHFAERSMYGYDGAPGYYAAPSFSPNNYDEADARSTDSFATMTVFPGTGAAIGEIIVVELADLMAVDKPIEIIEVGGGDGKLMANIIRGATNQMRREHVGTGVTPIMIDRTPQLLERQRKRVTDLPAGSGTVVRPEFHCTRIEDICLPAREVGAVVSNELLDMLPFEVAARSNTDRPGMVYVQLDASDKLDFVMAPASEEYEGAAREALLRNRHASVQSFQPGLLPTMQKLADLVKAGVIITADYGSEHGSDIQITRASVGKTHLYDELRFPGLFDISVKPDWKQILRWAKTRFGEEAVEFESFTDLIFSSESYHSIGDILSRRREKNIRRDGAEKQALELMGTMMRNYSSLLIRK